MLLIATKCRKRQIASSRERFADLSEAKIKKNAERNKLSKHKKTLQKQAKR